MKAETQSTKCSMGTADRPLQQWQRRRQIQRRRKRRRRSFGWNQFSVVAAIALLMPSLCHTDQEQQSTLFVSASKENDGAPLSGTAASTDTAYKPSPASLKPSPSLPQPALLPLKKKEPPAQLDRTMEEELQLHAQQQHNSNERIQKERSVNQQEQDEYQQFMDWCQKVLGIQTSLEIHTFYYYDYMGAILQNDNVEEDNDDDDSFLIEVDRSSSPSGRNKEWQDPPMIPVRGLRATRNISQGEIIISIPFQALLTVSTTIDQDPVLSRVMGPKARKSYGWTLEQDNQHKYSSNSNPDDDDVDFFELPLLAMALLHHYKLGTSSPMYPYIHLLKKSPLDSMPFLWDKSKRKKQYAQKGHSSVSRGIQTVARSIRLEMKDMYHTVVDALVLNHPDVFGHRNATNSAATEQYDILDDEEWAFSFENFQWAFAMVNSRHWLLPISDLTAATGAQRQHKPSPPAATPVMVQPQGSLDGVPPAEMPTDAWVGQQDQEESDDDDEHSDVDQQRNGSSKGTTSFHSFLAPVADLLNFGPPCTRGRYNEERHTFDIIASCDFIPGQEVTFWYSDECEEIVIGNYGFTHPMVPKCPTAEDYRLALGKWKQRANNLQEALEEAYEDMDVMDTELQHVQQILAGCDCCDTGKYNKDRQPSPPQDPRSPQHDRKGQQQHWPAAGTQPQDGLPNANSAYRKNNAVDDGLHGNYLRNPHDPAPSQIRGGNNGGNRRMSRNNNIETRPRSSPTGRSRTDAEGRSSGVPTDDDVHRHGVRRMWAGRSGL